MRRISHAELHIRSILEQDRIWSAYAIADLDPKLRSHSWWFANKTDVILTYKGFDPPVLFSHGIPGSLGSLFRQIPQGDYVFTLQQPSMDLLEDRFKVNFEIEMWRMSIGPDDYNPVSQRDFERLNYQNLNEIQGLFADHPDQPDSFDPSQLEDGVYFGIRDGSELVSVAGTHVLSIEYGVAALGNIFTRADHRNKGLGTCVSSTVVKTLLDSGIRTIVLNVATTNQPAIRSYTRIGFQPYCKYQEGLGTLTA
jgi:ribosomal protein S18 acetylase RimI-like enzyme